MLDSYKLRLSDGTLLVVDHDGLSTWLVDDKAMVQLVGSTHWRPLKAFLAGERAAARNASRQASSAAPALPLIAPPPRTEEKPVAATPPPSDPEPFFVGEPPAVQPQPESVDRLAKDGADGAWSADAGRRLEEVLPEQPSPSASVEPPFLGEPPVAPTLAEEPVVARPESVSPQPTPNDHDSPIRLKAVDDEVHGRPPASPSSEPRERRSIERPPSLLVLADDLAGPHSANKPGTSAADDELPIIRLKPRDDWDEAPESPGPAVYEAPPWQDPRDENLFRAVAAVGGFLSVWLGRLDLQLRRLPSIRPERLAPPRGLRDAAVRWVATVGGLLSRWMDRLGQVPRRPPSVSPEGPAPSASRRSDAPEWPPSISAPDLQPIAEALTDGDAFAQGGPTPLGGSRPPHEPLNPPPPISRLPVLRLADVDEPDATNEVYEGDSVIHLAWRWTKRVVVIGGLLAGGVFAALTSESWLPKAERLSRMVFAEIDKHWRSRDLTERRQRALQEATEQLPHLAPGTIELVLSGGARDLAEVFRLASDAADRGLSALEPGEVQELKALRQQVLDALRPDERQRVQEYDRARTRRPTLAFEDRDVLELMARGARALPPASRARLQVLEGEAVAAGLVSHPPVPARRPDAG